METSRSMTNSKENTNIYVAPELQNTKHAQCCALHLKGRDFI
jgi:hypothetical protein